MVIEENPVKRDKVKRLFDGAVVEAIIDGKVVPVVPLYTAVQKVKELVK